MKRLAAAVATFLLVSSCARKETVEADFALALGGHVNCALHGDNGGETNTHLDGPFVPMAKVLKEDPSGGLTLVESHACRYKGHRVEHFVFRTAQGLVSVFVDPTGTGATGKSSKHKEFQLERFALGRYAAYLVSELAPETSRLLAEQLKTQTSAVLEQKPSN